MFCLWVKQKNGLLLAVWVCGDTMNGKKEERRLNKQELTPMSSDEVVAKYNKRKESFKQFVIKE